MNKQLLAVIVLGLIMSFPVAVLAQGSGSFADDYVWQDRFKKSMAKAESGEAKAQYKVGEMYEKGRGTPKDAKQAFNWYQKAAKQNYMKAQYKLGYMYFKGVGVSKDRTKAYALLQKPAEKGNVRAQYYLGRLYAGGLGVEKDSEQALLWYSRSSLGGYSPAEEALAEVKSHLANMKAEEEAREKKSLAKAAKAKSKTDSKKTAKKAKAKKPVKVAKLDVMSNKLLKGGWMKRKRPADILPSKITKCERQSSTVVECLSGQLKRNIGTADITYVTKAIIFDMKDSGDFKVAYRNNILKIKKLAVEMEDDEEGSSAQAKVTVKKGWQETEHKLECKVKDEGTINCTKNKTRKVKFSRNVKI